MQSRSPAASIVAVLALLDSALFWALNDSLLEVEGDERS